MTTLDDLARARNAMQFDNGPPEAIMVDRTRLRELKAEMDAHLVFSAEGPPKSSIMGMEIIEVRDGLLPAPGWRVLSNEELHYLRSTAMQVAMSMT